ncbi:MAG TPA: maleylpyruvate isomerase family mycothiol-dependent enzyme [Nocardioidaceae bacterium]|nr:maleylpyruvate isomerase family mycothiol-dependent enzyme [Nocardioidaceae bacterium]
MSSSPGMIERYVVPWKAAVDDVVALLRGLDEDDWARPTDLPGWDVRAVAAHLAHVEAVLAGLEDDPAGVVPGPAGTVVAAYTEAGVRARGESTPRELVDELGKAAAIREAALKKNPPTDPKGTPDRTPGGVAWDWGTLLGNRVLDVWMHGQDVRRAVGRPGALDTAAARHTAGVFTRSFAYSVGKRVGPPDGTTVVLDVTGEVPVHLAVAMRDRRATPLPTDPDAPEVTLRMDLETFVILGGGRRAPETLTVDMAGDHDLGARVLAAMAVTP